MSDNLVLHVGDTDYKVEFTFEAAESDYVQAAFDYFSGAYMLRGVSGNIKNEALERIEQVNAMISGISAMPKMAVSLLYMGLLENHGPCGSATKDITNRNKAKDLYKQFCKENPENPIAMHSALFEALKGQMEKDGFFDRIGLSKMMENVSQATEKKVPQVAKKKSAKP